jgi:hypothetical protein
MTLADYARPLPPPRLLFARGIDPSLLKNPIRRGFYELSRVEWAPRLTPALSASSIFKQASVAIGAR